MRICDWSSDVCSSDLCPACTRVPSGCGVTRTPGSGVHASSSAVRRRAMMQVSVEPKTSRTSQPKRASAAAASGCGSGRSEEHTSELQSLMRISYAVFCLKKKKKTRQSNRHQHHRQYIHRDKDRMHDTERRTPE